MLKQNFGFYCCPVSHKLHWYNLKVGLRGGGEAAGTDETNGLDIISGKMIKDKSINVFVFRENSLNSDK